MDIKRVTSALLGLPMVIVVLLFGNKYVIDVAMAIVAIISLQEYFNAFRDYKPIRWIGYLLAFIICFIHMLPAEQLFSYIGLSIPIVIVALFIELVIKDLKINIIDIAITLFGIFYVVLFTMFIPLLAGIENGKILIWYAIFAAWGSDTTAYIVGKTLKLGKHKFSKVSPKKSIEGSVAGIIATSIVFGIYTNIVVSPNLELTWAEMAFVGIIISLISQIGDLSASSIKRYCGIKDFGSIMPGHGGILDSFDSIIMISPFVYIFLQILL